MLINSDVYSLEERGNTILFQKILPPNTIFTKFFSVLIALVALGAFFLVNIIFEWGFILYGVICLIIALCYSLSIFFRDEAQVMPFLLFDKKKQRLKIHNGFDVPYERISLMKVHVWKDDEGGKYCSVRIQASNGPAVFDSTFFSNKTDWNMFANVLKREVNVEFINEVD